MLLLFNFSAITSLKGALWSLFRNLLAVSFLYGFCYGAMLVRRVKICDIHCSRELFSQISICRHDLQNIKLGISLTTEMGEPNIQGEEAH